MNAPRTLNHLYFGAMSKYDPQQIYMRVRTSEGWVDQSYQDIAGRVHEASLGLLSLGLHAGDRVALLSENRPEWGIIDFACLLACCTDVPIYPTLPANQIAYILRDAGARAVCVSTGEQLAKVLEIRRELPDLTHVIVFEQDAVQDGVLPLRGLYQAGRAAIGAHPEWKEAALQVEPDDVATLIYTSGTTGDPKGVVLTHGNITSNVLGAEGLLPVRAGDETISFLPLSHIFERMVGHYTSLWLGVTVSFAERIDTLMRDVKERRPHYLAAVPRVYEKIYAAVLDAASANRLSRAIFFWAKRAAETWATLSLAHQPIPRSIRLQRWIADRLIFTKLRARFGNRIRFFISGGAPLSAELAKFFYAARLPILEGYGLTETSPVITINTFDDLRLGTVGQPLPNVEVRIADDGEVLCRGPNVMQGYYNRPDATAEAIDAGGWFHTGDIGMLDEDGFLRITDRKKDLIVTSGGKNIAPQPIENLLKSNPFIANAVMLGDRRKFPIVLLVPDFGQLERFAATNRIPFQDHTELVRHPAIQALMEGEAKKHLRDLARFEVPKRMIVLNRDFTVEQGEMTPKQSVKRKVVEQHFHDVIEDAYQSAAHANDHADHH